MPDFRRHFHPGGTFFFTVITHQRTPFLCDPPARLLLRKVVRRCQTRWPFTMEAVVLLPDHLHAIWTLPPGDAEYSKRLGWIKKEFTRIWLISDSASPRQTQRRGRDRYRSVWQRKFWEHTMRSDVDFRRHMDYIHFNPIKHGLARCPHEWPWSSFHRWVRQGVYDQGWACACEQSRRAGCTSHQKPLSFEDIAHSVGE